MKTFLEKYRTQLANTSFWGTSVGTILGIMFTNAIIFTQLVGIWVLILQIIVVIPINYFISLPLIYMGYDYFITKR